MKVKIYQEFQGTGSPHADPQTGMCWCAQSVALKTVAYLKAKGELAAIKEAALMFGVTEAEVSK